MVIHQYPEVFEWVGNISSHISENKLVFYSCMVLLAVATLLYYPSIGGDYDMWFHLAYGKHFAQNLTWNIDHTVYSWTPTIQGWKYVTWIGSGILYIVYTMMGISGLYILQWTIFLALLCLLVLFLKHLGQTLTIWHLLSFLLVAIVFKLVSMFIKPEMFSTLFFTICVSIYFFVKAGKNSRLLYLYPPLFLLWVNTHGGFIIGLFLISFLFGLEWIQSFWIKNNVMDRNVLRHFLLSLLLSYVAVQINPHGVYFLPDVINTQLFDQDRTKHLKSIYAHLSLWRYLNPTNAAYNFVNSALGLLFMGVAFMLLSYKDWQIKRNPDYAVLIVNVFFFLFSMQTARAVIYYPPIWFFSCSYIIWKNGSNKLIKKFSPVCLVSFVGISVYIIYISLVINPYRSYFGVDTQLDYPVKETEFIMNHHLPGPVFNDYLTGGYMMWSMFPEYKVFIDPRYTPYKNEMLDVWFSLGSKYPLTNEGLDSFLKDYPFKIALLHVGQHKIIFWLLKSQNWRMAYFDTAAAVLIHKSVIPTLSEKALDTDLAPRRYKDITNPQILMQLFNFYVNIRPELGKEIRYIYEKNVSDWYKFKSSQIALMDNSIAQKKSDK